MRSQKIVLTLGLSALALSLPVLAQSGPESLLPPGFGDTPAAPPARPTTPAPARPAAPAPAQTPATQGAAGQATPILPTSSGIDNAAAAVPLDGLGNDSEVDAITEKYDLPSSARRSLESVGPLTAQYGGLAGAAFGTQYGGPLAKVMQATRAPFMSRWASILLRRALLSDTETPRGIGGADWVAERAWLLLRMGEADNARLLIQQVDSDRFSRRLYSVAMQAHLATADPAGFCPLLPRARDFSDEPGWFMAQAICASFSADQGTASALLNQAQRRGIARGIDYRLAEKAVGAGPNSRRSVKIEWDGISQLTTWRYGLATATNVEIPDALFRTAGPQVRAWQARAANLSEMQRRTGTAVATRLGVFSGNAGLGFHAALAASNGVDTAAGDQAERLRIAYAGNSASARIDAMREFWQNTQGDSWMAGPGGVFYGALPVIARAAATVPVDAAAGDDAPWLIAAMLSAGYDRNAARWASVIGDLGGDAAMRSWALLAAGAPNAAVDLSAARIEAFVDADNDENKLLGNSLVAVLAGLDRLPTEGRAEILKSAGLNLTANRPWSRALMAAAARREQGTVALLAAVGMQGMNWQRIKPDHLYFITSALRQVGLEPYARMVAAEAMTRL